MPILWRYLLRNYLQVLALCVGSFIAILLVMRFHEIARFASSGTSFIATILFTLFQIPYILPIAIPVSGLIAAMLLFQRMSHTHELTALRACGLGLTKISYPLILTAVLLTIINATIAFEVAPRCRGLSKKLIYEATAENPLFLFQKDSLVKLKRAYIDIGQFSSGEAAEDLVLVLQNQSNQRLALMTAKHLYLDGEMLNGDQVTLISSIDPKFENGFDHLVIENQTSMFTKSADLTQYRQKKDWRASYDYLTLRKILLKESMEKEPHRLLALSDPAIMEISRRLSVTLAAFTFTLIGIAFGMEISRSHTKRGLIWAISLGSFYLICFVIAKSFKDNSILSLALFLLPHPLIALLTLRSFKRIKEGIE